MDEIRTDKIERVLGIYTKLMNGYLITKAEEATNYGVNERSIQRDFDDIRNYLETECERTGFVNTVIYDRTNKGYRLEQIYKMKFSNSEVLAICKILLDSRAFTKKEMLEMLGKLISCCVPKANQQMVTDLISNEEFNYVQPRHKTKFIDTMWDLGQAIKQSRYVELDYHRKDKKIVTRRVKPAAIMFSEYYFYLAAYIDDEKLKKEFEDVGDDLPTIYRIDRITKLTVLDERFHVLYSNRFEEGEFRKRVQFMYSGKLRKVRFKYLGPDVDSILDRLPTAVIENEKNGVYTIKAEVYGTGIDMWLKSQGNYVEVVG